MLRVFVALGKQLPKNKKMIEDTEEVARILAKYNCTMVQGGAKIGLMGVVVKEFQKYSEEVVMIVPEVHKDDLIGAVCKEHYIVDGESDRMRISIHTCDMFVVLPGGSGTLAEVSYYNETCKSGEHNAKIVVVNSKGFYNKLFKFHKHQIKEGFMGEDACKYEVISDAKHLEPIVQKLIAEKQAKIQQEQLAKEKEELAKSKSAKTATKKAANPKETKKAANPKATKKAETKTSIKAEKKPVKEVKSVAKEKVETKKVATKSVSKSAPKAKPTVKTTPVKKVAENAKVDKKAVKEPVKTTKTAPKAKSATTKSTKAVEPKDAKKPATKAKTTAKATSKKK